MLHFSTSLDPRSLPLVSGVGSTAGPHALLLPAQLLPIAQDPRRPSALARTPRYDFEATPQGWRTRAPGHASEDPDA